MLSMLFLSLFAGVDHAVSEPENKAEDDGEAVEELLQN